jgi:Ni/Co efflux regulator RcnB
VFSAEEMASPRRHIMKKFIIAALAATIIAGPVMAQPYQGHDNRGQQAQRFDRDDRRGDNRRSDYRNDRRGNDHRYDNRRWNRGERFDYRQARNYRVIGNPGYYHLRNAPRGYRWVQSGNDAVMIGIATGLVASVLAGAFN